jgi:hypothetical protein
VEVEIEKPHVAHRSTGIRHLDLILPITALFVSLVSILIAWHHSQIMRELVHENERIVAAESLPYLDIYSSDVASDLKTPTLRLSIQNEGVGPARIAEVAITVNGKPVPDFNTLIDQCCAPGLLRAKGADSKQYRSLRNGEVVLSSVRDRMIRPGDSADVFAWPITLENKPIIDRLQAGLASDAVNISVCYCSVFDECWLRTDGGRRPVAVKKCPVVSVPYRQ